MFMRILLLHLNQGTPRRTHYQWCSRSLRTRPTTHDNEYLQVKVNGLKGKYCDLMEHNTASTMRLFSFFIFFFYFNFFKFYFVFVGYCKGRGWMEGDREMPDIQSTKNQ